MYWTLELAGSLDDAPWPATKDELIDYANRSGAPEEVIENLQELERRFGNSQASAAKTDEKKLEAQKDFQEKKASSKESRKVKNRISWLECEIGKREKRMAEIETLLAAPGPDDDIMELTREYLERKRDLDAMTDEWATLMED